MTATLDVNVNPRGAVSGSQVAEAALGRLGVKATQVERSLLSLGSASNRVGLAFQALTAGFVAGNILKASGRRDSASSFDYESGDTDPSDWAASTSTSTAIPEPAPSSGL